MNQYENSEVVKDNSGKLYHIGLTGNDITDHILLVGDPDRAKRVSKKFNKIYTKKENREYVTITGKYKNMDLTVMATGIGCDNTEIAIIELCQLKFPLTIIRCGTCGALQEDINLEDLVISQACVRLECTSTYFVEDSYPAIAHHEIYLALMKAASELKNTFHFGITATTSGFYGAQCRNIDGFPLKDPYLMDRLKNQGVKNYEMESSTLFTLASLKGFRTGTVCAVVASRTNNQFIAPDKKNNAEKKAIETALFAFEIIHKMDQQKNNQKYWLPDL